MTVRSPSRLPADGCLQATGLLKNSFIVGMASHQKALVDFVIKGSCLGNQ
jgi:hypothetical protein